MDIAHTQVSSEWDSYVRMSYRLLDWFITSLSKKFRPASKEIILRAILFAAFRQPAYSIHKQIHDLPEQQLAEV